MNGGADRDLLAIDLGSSCVKLGWFRGAGGCASKPASSELAIAVAPLPTPDETARVDHRGRDTAAWGDEIDRWLDATPPARGAWCLVGSVQPKIAAPLLERLARRGWERLQALSAADVPLEIRTTEPARVGIDRILDAVAVNRVRRAGTPAIIVDMGTAITVDLVGADGAFEGGAILTGPVLALSALHAGTASLPPLGLDGSEPPPPSLGKSTEQALVAGAFWGAAGGVRELARRTAELAGGEPEFYLTGGGAPGYAHVLDLDGRRPRHLPHLVLSGIGVVAEEFAVSVPPSVDAAACASLLTPAGRGAVAVVAATGAAALAVIDAHFRAANRLRLSDQVENAIVFGHWTDVGDNDGATPLGEEAVVCRTGPSHVEVHCHGGVAAAGRILAALAEAGVRIEPWSDWLGRQAACALEAEAEIALTSAVTLRTAALLLDQRHGALRRDLEELQAHLARDEGSAADGVRARLGALVDGSEFGNHLTRPWQVTIAGRPNVGKSSLINALLGYQRAIVFDQPGTTRDVLAAETAIDGWPVRLADSAGLRATSDPLESAGVDLARRQIVRAELVLWVLDAGELAHANLPAADAIARREFNVEAGVDPSPPLVVLNKIDLAGPPPWTLAPGVVAVSALTGHGLDELLAAISRRLVPRPPVAGAALLFTARQAAWVREALRRLVAGDAVGASAALTQLLAGAAATSTSPQR